MSTIKQKQLLVSITHWLFHNTLDQLKACRARIDLRGPPLTARELTAATELIDLCEGITLQYNPSKSLR